MTRMRKFQPENVKDFVWCSNIWKSIYVRNDKNEKISNRKCHWFPMVLKKWKPGSCVRRIGGVIIVKGQTSLKHFPKVNHQPIVSSDDSENCSVKKFMFNSKMMITNLFQSEVMPQINFSDIFVNSELIFEVIKQLMSQTMHTMKHLTRSDCHHDYQGVTSDTLFNTRDSSRCQKHLKWFMFFS